MGSRYESRVSLEALATGPAGAWALHRPLPSTVRQNRWAPLPQHWSRRPGLTKEPIEGALHAHGPKRLPATSFRRSQRVRAMQFCMAQKGLKPCKSLETANLTGATPAARLP